MTTDKDAITADGFRTLWPTIMMERELPGHEAANTVLAEYIEDLDSRHADLTTDYLGGNFLTDKHPAVQWLKECVNKSIIDYFRHLGLNFPIDWTVQGWTNVNRLGDYHDPHNHPHAYLGGTYYVRVPDTKPVIGSRSDLRPGRISFYDPRNAVNMTAIRDDPNVDPEHTVQPRGGMILLWPAFLHHFVHPNLSDEPRISISFNVVLKWRDEYMPVQR